MPTLQKDTRKWVESGQVLTIEFPRKRKNQVAKGRKDGLGRWFAEEWTDVRTGKPCGRKSAKKSKRGYPYCRPKKRVSSKTPKTSSEMTAAEKRKKINEKKRIQKKKKGKAPVRVKSLKRKKR